MRRRKEENKMGFKERATEHLKDNERKSIQEFKINKIEYQKEKRQLITIPKYRCEKYIGGNIK